MDQKVDNVQVLVTTMHQRDFSKVEEMRILSDAVFTNQTNNTDYLEKDYGEFKVQMINTETRGVGINRNLGLLYASGDILLLADDDMVYEKDYVASIKRAFSEHSDADAIIFNIKSVSGQRENRFNHESKRVRIYNCLNYGAVRIAVRRKSLLNARITFTHFFGGGTKYSSGEDSLFICDMLRSGFKIYTSPSIIATTDDTSSTWFNGYNEKYLYDKGALYKAIFPVFTEIFCLQDLIRHKNIYKDAKLTFKEAFKIMKDGIKGFEQLKSWDEKSN